MSAHIEHPLPAELRHYTRPPELHILRQGATCHWVVLMPDWPVVNTAEACLAYIEWLRARFGPDAAPAPELGAWPPVGMEASARKTLALLLAEGKAGSTNQAIIDATAAVRQAAPDLTMPLPVRRNAATGVIYSSKGVRMVRSARATIQKLERVRRQAASTTEKGNAAVRFLYAKCSGHYGMGGWCPASYLRWRILRVTPKFLFVDPEYDSRNRNEDWVITPSGCDGLGRQSTRIPRDLSQIDYYCALRLGYCNRGSFSSYTLIEAELPPLTAEAPGAMFDGGDPDAAALGLGGRPLTLRAVKAAYRRQAREVHPDAGGSAEAFQQLTEAYERLCSRIGSAAAA